MRAHRLSRLSPALLGASFGLAAMALSASALAECPASAGDCAPLLENGRSGARVDLVILGDGYTDAERDKFYSDAQNAVTAFFVSDTYGEYEPVFNAYALFTPSAESGADHPASGVLVDTAFDAEYDYNGISYLLVANYTAVLSEVNQRFPEKDLTLLLVNDTAYGGSGGQVAIISLHSDSSEIGRHELGHTLANLADEYTAPYPGFPDGDPEPNVATADHLDPVKWDMWLTPGVEIPTPDSAAVGPHDPIGAFEGARYKETGVFRPAPKCIMRELNVTFCPVCAEAMVKSFHELSLLIDDPLPASPSSIPAKSATTFSVTVPALTNLMFTWSVDGNVIAATGPTFNLTPAAISLADGNHTVELTVTDATPLVRNDPMAVLKETHVWDVAVDSSLDPPTGAGGSGGAGGTGSGGDGGSGGGQQDDGSCDCRAAGAPLPAPPAWLLAGLMPLALAARRRKR